jgi:hypothetical protein
VAAAEPKLFILSSHELHFTTHLLHLSVFLIRKLVLLFLPLPLKILYKSPKPIHLELQISVFILKSLDKMRIHLVFLELINPLLPLNQLRLVIAFFSHQIL